MDLELPEPLISEERALALPPGAADELASGEPELERARARAKKLFELGGSANTARAYAQDWRRFSAWCVRHAKQPLPASERTLADFVAHLVDDRRPRSDHERGGVCRRSTIKRALASIVARHGAAALDPPVTPRLREFVRRVCRALATDLRQAPPLTAELLRAVVSAMQASVDNPITIRDRAILLVGWAGALRRSEISGLDAGDLEFVDGGLKVRLRRSKADRVGEGAVVGVRQAEEPMHCPIAALEAWLLIRGSTGGPVFCRTWHGKLTVERIRAREVNAIVKRWTSAAGLAPAAGVPFSAHSLRAGFITTAVAAGKPESRIMKHTRHADVRTFMAYVRGDVFAGHPGQGLL